MKCSCCGKDIEDWAYENEDADGNLYCMECVEEVKAKMELEDLGILD